MGSCQRYQNQSKASVWLRNYTLQGYLKVKSKTILSSLLTLIHTLIHMSISCCVALRKLSESSIESLYCMFSNVIRKAVKYTSTESWYLTDLTHFQTHNQGKSISQLACSYSLSLIHVCMYTPCHEGAARVSSVMDSSRSLRQFVKLIASSDNTTDVSYCKLKKSNPSLHVLTLARLSAQ